MLQVNEHLSTGLSGLDNMMKGLIPGDNIVWRVDGVEQYAPFIQPYRQSARFHGQRLVYIRFASHKALLTEDDNVEVYTLDASAGFESFINELHSIIDKSGYGTWYVFDCLSELATIWNSDAFLANFFVLTCPYLYDMQSVAYFCLIRNFHSIESIDQIVGTAQVFLDVYNHKGTLFLQPMKVEQRRSPTMHMLHIWQDDDFAPVADSATTTEILGRAPCLPRIYNRYRHGIWNRTFRQAELIIQSHSTSEQVNAELEKDTFQQLIGMALTSDPRMLELVEQYFNMEDILAIGERIIGTGQIGGKAVGMLLSRKILEKANSHWKKIMEPHDSFYIGADVFTTFIVQNGLWWKWLKHRDQERHLHKTERIRQHILVGHFPDHIQTQMQDMLDYFGQSPIIVRSSSLLEDSFGHSFVGKYESVFLAGQSSREQRMQDFISAVKTIYSSVVSEAAIAYRARRGLLKENEQMGLLVQRVSGSVHGTLFYPHVAGVGLSYNPYVWGREIDPNAGVLRIVFGLGSRAVDRTDDDYTRLVALNAPGRTPTDSPDDALKYVQRKSDVLDLHANQLVSKKFGAVAKASPGLPLEIIASINKKRQEVRRGSSAKGLFPWVITFDNLLKQTDYADTMRQMLRHLQDTYGSPVDVEFTTNFLPDNSFRINLVQCRPLQVSGDCAVTNPPEHIESTDLVLKAQGAIIGRNQFCSINRIIHVVPSVYSMLSISDRHMIARLVGKVIRHDEGQDQKKTMLIGPGRWGTSSPELGVPTSFAEICKVSVLVEIVAMRENLVPEVSLGSHFFNEMVESDILYFALFPDIGINTINSTLLESLPNQFEELMPEDKRWSEAIRVIDLPVAGESKTVKLNANIIEQQVICYLE